MAWDDALVRWSVRAALALYVFALLSWPTGEPGGRRARLSRWLWTVGCAAMLAHVALAFHFAHGWSHGVAWRETARQTYEVVGWRWGGGLWANYAFAALWTADVAWWWLAGRSPRRLQPRAWTVAINSFMAFISFNATVVFETGWTRACGIGATVLLAAVIVRRLYRGRGSATISPDAADR
jgi:hypothetical protein